MGLETLQQFSAVSCNVPIGRKFVVLQKMQRQEVHLCSHLILANDWFLFFRCFDKWQRIIFLHFLIGWLALKHGPQVVEITQGRALERKRERERERAQQQLCKSMTC